MQPFLSLLTNYTNQLGHKYAHACLHLVFYSSECECECCQLFYEEVYPLTQCYFYGHLNITDIYQLSCSYQGIASITGQD